ncbi:MAG: hypothetical protein U0930_13530 [Pirellulales bacterium]
MLNDDGGKPGNEAIIGRFSIGHLFILTTSVAIICSVAVWLGSFYGIQAVVPAVLTLIVLALTRCSTTVGACRGVIVLVVLAMTVLARVELSDPRFWKDTILLGLFGSAFGSSIHALKLRYYFMGIVCFTLALIWLLLIPLFIVETPQNLKRAIPNSSGAVTSPSSP